MAAYSRNIHGVEVKSGTSPAYNILDSGSLRLASRPTGDLKMLGGLDDVVFYDRAITPTEVLARYNYSEYADPLPGFLTNYLFDGNDSSLIPINSPPLLVGLDLPDQTGSSLNGVDQLFDAGADLPLLNSIGTSDFSFGGWIKSSALSFESLFTTSDEGIDGSGFKIAKAGTGKIQFRIGGGILVTTANVIMGDWVHSTLRTQLLHMI